MGWETSTDTLEEVILKFPTKAKSRLNMQSLIILLIQIIEPKKKNLLLNLMQRIFLRTNYVA